MRKLAVSALAALALGVPAAASAETIEVDSGMTVRCPPGNVSCAATIEAETAGRATHGKHTSQGRRVAVGRATITIAPQASAKLIFKLNGIGKRLLHAQGHLLIGLTVTVAHGTDAPIVSTHQITVGAPTRKHPHRR